MAHKPSKFGAYTITKEIWYDSYSIRHTGCDQLDRAAYPHKYSIRHTGCLDRAAYPHIYNKKQDHHNTCFGCGVEYPKQLVMILQLLESNLSI